MSKVIYEDNHLLVLDKPAGLLTQPNDTEADSLEAQAKAYLKEKYQKKGAVYLHAVHRLDKPVSGIVLFAKTSKALSRLNEQLRKKEMRKVYVAEVEGHLAEEGVLEHFLRHDDFHTEAAEEKEKGAKLAKLTYRTLQRKETTILLEISLETGRYHQIRAQLALEGHPVVGDQKYGSKMMKERIHLHHSKLEFLHPVTKTRMDFISRHLF